MLTHLERQDGYKVRLIEGVEEDPYLLGSTLDRQLGACVIIACLSDALGPSQFRRIEGVYNARKGPQHYLDTIFVEPDETLAMAESVRGVVTKARGKLAASAKPKPKPDPAASSSAHRMRDVVGVTTLSAVGTDAIASPNAALGTSESKLSLGKPAPITEAAAAQSQAAQSQNAQSQNAQSQNAQSPNTQSQSMSAASSQLMFEAAKRKNPGWVAPILFLIFLAVAGTVVLLLLLQQQQNDDGITQRGAPGLNQSTGQGDKAPEGETKQAAAKADESQTAAGQAGGESETGDEAGESESETGESETGESEAAAPEGDGDESEADRIVEAIQNGEMRAVDLILIAKTSELSAWRDAANRCRSKSVNGVRSWRLPTLDELKTIRKARMVERDRYWSSTLATQVGTGTDHVYVLDLAERSIAPMSKETPDVRVICVRPALKN